MKRYLMLAATAWNLKKLMKVLLLPSCGYSSEALLVSHMR